MIKYYPKRPAPRPTINVLEDTIETSVRHSSSHCMIADTIRIDVPGASRISVDLQIRWSDKAKGLRYTYLTPRIAQQALILFDRGQKPPPFKFSLRGGQVTTMYVRTTSKSGKQRVKAVHKLGRRKLNASLGDIKSGHVPEVVGGKPPPRVNRSARREFGLRAFTLDDLVPEKS